MNSTKWLTLAAIIMMLASMLMYILSDDEAVEPGAAFGVQAPAVEMPAETTP